MNSQVTIGCDPEFFIQRQDAASAKNKNKEVMVPKMVIVPICGLLGGTKKAPLQIPELADGFLYQEDGIAAEINIPPQTTAPGFGAAVAGALGTLAATKIHSKGVSISKARSTELLPEWVEKWPNLLQIGCDPDFSAYEGVGYRKLDMSKIKNVRGAGGHLHIGGYPPELIEPAILARLLDCVLAIPYLDEDRQGERRAFWGQPGLYRPKPYGMEYRTLSNFWIWSASKSTWIAAHVFSLLESLSRNMVQWHAFYNSVNWEKLVKTISEEDVRSAREMLNEFMSARVYSDAYSRAGVLAAPTAKLPEVAVNG